MAARFNPNRAWEKWYNIFLLLRDHLPEPAPPLLLSLLRPPPAKPTANSSDFWEPIYRPVLVVTDGDLAPFSPRDWDAFLAATRTSPCPSTAASPSPTTTADPPPSTEERSFSVEVGLFIALAGASILFAVVAIKYRKNRRRGVLGVGARGSGGGGWGRRRLRGEPTGLISLLPRRDGARLTRRSFDDAGRLARNAEADGAAWLARLAAAGTPGRDHDNLDLMRRVVLKVRQALSFRLPVEAIPLESRKSGSISSSFLLSYLEKHQASVPEWKNKPSDKETEDYKAESLPKLGTIVCPLNMDISATYEPEKRRKEWVDNCNCSHPGSEHCVRVHVKKARAWIKEQLGEEAFKNCGLDVMGEQVGDTWTAVDKKKLEDVDKSIPQNKPQKFMKTALKELSQKETKDLVRYYYNVFLPRSLASLTRAEHRKNEAVDTEDDKNEPRPRKKCKSCGSS